MIMQKNFSKKGILKKPPSFLQKNKLTKLEIITKINIALHKKWDKKYQNSQTIKILLAY